MQAGTEYFIVADNPDLSEKTFEFIIVDAELVCPGNSKTLTMELLNSGGLDTYSWVVDKGNGAGYVPVTDDSYHSNVNSNVLYISNMPTLFYGYKYRGIGKAIGGFGSFTRTTNFKQLKFVSSWKGLSSNWNDPTNWTCNQVPDLYTDVLINAGTPVTPVININTTVRSLDIKPGANVKLNAGMNLVIRK